MLDTLFKKRLGKKGEDLAFNFLKKNGYQILERNFRIRGGEIDIIARDKEVLVFVEVKTRYSHEYGLPSESMTYFKLRSLLKTAQFYIQKIKWGDRQYRIDFVGIDYSVSKDIPKIELIKNITQ